MVFGGGRWKILVAIGCWGRSLQGRREDLDHLLPVRGTVAHQDGARSGPGSRHTPQQQLECGRHGTLHGEILRSFHSTRFLALRHRCRADILWHNEEVYPWALSRHTVGTLSQKPMVLDLISPLVEVWE